MVALSRRQHLSSVQSGICSNGEVDRFATLLGRNVRASRVTEHIKVEVAAAALQISLEEYQACEHGSTRFTPSQVVDLCELLHIMPSILFEDRI
jgi:hypothetical protein